jgi:N-succinyldiaminopimelate aminotransferase
MNPDIDRLQAYPFERLARLKQGITPPSGLTHIPLSIGEPRHPAPPAVVEALRGAMDGLGSYPATAGSPELRGACARWLERRFGLPDRAVDEARMVIPVNGTREALFSIAQAVVDASGPERPAVVMPNPFYQIYEGAALLAGADPWFMDTTPQSRMLPDLEAVPEHVWRRCQLLYLCSPGNPTGAVMSLQSMQRALELADRFGFVVASDECYSELYLDESAPPPSLLAAAWQAGRRSFERCIVFHSLSKRSSLPGLRSGFAAGDPTLMGRFLLYRTYQGGAMPPPTQVASVAAWNDESHVRENRALYRRKFDAVLPILSPCLDVERPEGGFYLWARVEGDDTAFARDLFAARNVTLLPGSYLARDAGQGNPGSGRLRISLVASIDDCVEAAHRLRTFIEGRRP